MARKKGMSGGRMFESEEHAPYSGKGKTHSLEYKIEYFPDNDMHGDVHDKMHGYRDGSHMKGGMNVREAERELKTHSGGRLAKRHRQYEAAGGRDIDDTVYGRLPPVPGRIDS